MNHPLTHAFCVSLLILFGCGERPEPEANTTVASVEKKVELNAEKLLGRWMRTDGEYTLEVKAIKGDSYLAVAYFNPNPIHCEKGTYAMEGGALKIHVLLNDTGYPKCTYDLEYDDEKKILFGAYFQAAAGQTYHVVFEKML